MCCQQPGEDDSISKRKPQLNEDEVDRIITRYVTPNVKEGLAHCLKCTDQDHL